MDVIKNRPKEFLVCVLLLSNILVWALIYRVQPSNILSVYFLDVGQGDAILIDSPNHSQLLIDGGRNRKVLAELGKVLPFNDREIDIVLVTHPDADHIGGLPEVISRYDVGLFIEPGVESGSSLEQELYRRLETKSVTRLRAHRGMVINFGDGARLSILFPNQDVSEWNPNDASTVARLSYGEHAFLLTGDATFRTENVLLRVNSAELDVEVLKAGHHGSNTSTSLAFATQVDPLYTVISAGANNSYGHPHQSVLEILEQVGSVVVSTVELGTIKFETDGQKLLIK